jgi:hypothetical protein
MPCSVAFNNMTNILEQNLTMEDPSETMKTVLVFFSVVIYCTKFQNVRHVLTLDIGIIHLFCLIANFMITSKRQSQYTTMRCAMKCTCKRGVAATSRPVTLGTSNFTLVHGISY